MIESARFGECEFVISFLSFLIYEHPNKVNGCICKEFIYIGGGDLSSNYSDESY